jgi:type I restriction enzyme S subunit
MGGVRMEWKEDVLGNVLEVKYGKDHKKLADGQYPVYGSGGLMRYVDSKLYDGPSILIPRKGTLNNIMFVESPFWTVDTMFWSIINTDKVDPKFLFYSICKRDFASMNVGSAVPSMTVNILNDIQISYPKNIEDQRRIASILSSLDRKIELNNKINADLEEMAQAIFKNWFVDFEPFKDGKFVDSELGMIPEGWKVGRLTEIASYMNGLAMQKFPPENNEDSLPVLKIKELGQGFCGPDSDRCSCNIKDECKIHNGDVIFSWSGTLLVDVWCGGDCGLNQHLFKVTSKDYPKWFYYYWTKHHLQEFIHIAKDKAVTMGHIKRGHLEEAMVAILDNDSMEKAHELFEPILSKMISLRLENSRLSLLRDTLLPRLMSGELEVPE